MKDTVLKGTGNSRYLKSVEDFKARYPTYDDFVAALVAGTLPIDLNGINEAGMDQVGTAINKASLLTDDNAAMYGLDGDATVDDMWPMIQQIRLDDVYTGHQQNAEALQVDPLSVERSLLAAASTGKYALFGGGRSSGTPLDTVDAYSASLVHSTPTPLVGAKYSHSAVTVGNYALFGGGTSTDVYSTSNAAVDAYSQELVRASAPPLTSRRKYMGVASVGEYGLFAGGQQTLNDDHISSVNAYNTALVQSTPTGLTYSKQTPTGATTGNYALIGGGNTYNSATTDQRRSLDAYNASLVRTSAGTMLYYRPYAKGASVGDYALFAGGTQSGDSSHTVEAYNPELVRSMAPDVSATGAYTVGAAASVEAAAFFGGGTEKAGDVTDLVTAYTPELVRFTPTTLSVARSALAATAVNNSMVLFGGGVSSGTGSNATDAYRYGFITDFIIPRFSAYKFDGYHATEQVALTDLAWSSAGKLSGYIKRGGFALSGNISST